MAETAREIVGVTIDRMMGEGTMASFTEGIRGFGPDRLALVIVAENDSLKPLLRESRQLLLDVDGTLFQTHPMPDPRLYALEATSTGLKETVIVPIDRHLLTLMVESETVRGRVGHWLAFDLSDDVRDRLGDLLTALPEDFPAGRRRVASSPLHRANH